MTIYWQKPAFHQQPVTETKLYRSWFRKIFLPHTLFYPSSLIQQACSSSCVERHVSSQLLFTMPNISVIFNSKNKKSKSSFCFALCSNWTRTPPVCEPAELQQMCLISLDEMLWRVNWLETFSRITRQGFIFWPELVTVCFCFRKQLDLLLVPDCTAAESESITALRCINGASDGDKSYTWSHREPVWNIKWEGRRVIISAAVGGLMKRTRQIHLH